MAFSSQFAGAPWLNAPKKANGLLGLLGVSSNPFTDFLGNNSNALIGLGAGIAGGGPDLGQAVGQGLTLAGQGKTADFARSEKVKADAQLAAQTNQTLQYLQKNRPDLVQAVQGGGLSLSDAWKMALSPDPTAAPIKVGAGDTLLDPNSYQPLYTAPSAASSPDPFTLSPGQVRYGPDGKPIASAPEAQNPFTLGPGDTRFGIDGKPVAVGQPAIKTENVPAGYRANPDGTYSFIPGGPADPSTAGKTTEATRRNQQLATVIVPELNRLLGSGTTPGTFDALASPKDQALGSNGLTYGLASPEYQQAQNSIRTIVASYLYSVSGATANPGEVETQTRSLTPVPFESPQSVADKKKRLQTMVQAVVAAASGTPIAVDTTQLPPDTSAPAPSPNGGTTSNGVQWSVSP